MTASRKGFGIRQRPTLGREPPCISAGWNGKKWWLADVVVLKPRRHDPAMENYVWKSPERRDLYLAARILSGENGDGDWVQWASDTLVQDLELYDDPRQGVGSWLGADEAEIANKLGECLWRVVGADPFSAANTIAGGGAELRSIASRLVERMKANGRAVN